MAESVFPRQDIHFSGEIEKKRLTREGSCNIISKSVIVNKCSSKAPEQHLTINNDMEDSVSGHSRCLT